MMVQGNEKVYALMLLGVVDKPMPSYLHLKRECFVLSSITELPEVDGGRFYRKSKKDGQLRMTKNGRALFNEFLEKHADKTEFREALTTAAFVREVYDDMTAEEISYLESRAKTAL